MQFSGKGPRPKVLVLFLSGLRPFPPGHFPGAAWWGFPRKNTWFGLSLAYMRPDLHAIYATSALVALPYRVKYVQLAWFGLHEARFARYLQYFRPARCKEETIIWTALQCS